MNQETRQCICESFNTRMVSLDEGFNYRIETWKCEDCKNHWHIGTNKQVLSTKGRGHWRPIPIRYLNPLRVKKVPPNWREKL